jgi:uncharacterized protein with PIN domain
MTDIQRLTKSVVNGELTGEDLKNMVESNDISKTERRRIAKLAKAKKAKLAVMTDRQKLRMEVKEKKSLPKLSQDDRNARFRKTIEDDREREQANFTTCLNCRKRGHFVKDCPRLKGKAHVEEQQEAKGGVFCYNCGSYGHALRHCAVERDANGYLPYAVCFICKQEGHLARSCPNNSHGLYPKGGCCHICGKIDHLARDCPDRPEEVPMAESHSTVEEASSEGTKSKKRALAELQTAGVSDDAMAPVYDEDDEDEDEDNQKKKKSKSSKKQKR